MRTLCLKCPCFLFLGFHHFDPLEFSIFHRPAAVWESVYLCCFFFLCLHHNDTILYLWICIIMHRVLKRQRESLEERWLCASLRKQTFRSLGRFPSYCWSLIQTYFLYWHHTRYLERGMICTFYWQPQRSLRLTGFSTQCWRGLQGTAQKASSIAPQVFFCFEHQSLKPFQYSTYLTQFNYFLLSYFKLLSFLWKRPIHQVVIFFRRCFQIGWRARKLAVLLFLQLWTLLVKSRLRLLR